MGDIALDVGQRDVDFWVFQFVVLVETALTAVRFGTGFDCALVISFYLIGVSAHSFSLFVIPLAVAHELLILVKIMGTSYLLNRLMSWFFY